MRYIDTPEGRKMLESLGRQIVTAFDEAIHREQSIRALERRARILEAEREIGADRPAHQEAAIRMLRLRDYADAQDLG